MLFLRRLCILAVLLCFGAAGNPLLRPSALPFGAPAFNQYHDSDFLPALRTGMAQQRKEIDAIANNPAPPTFANTIVAIERSGRTLDRVQNVFDVLTSTSTTPALQDIQRTIAPEMAAHHDAISLNGRLFARVRRVYMQRTTLHLDQEDGQLLAVTYRSFLESGAALSPASQAKLRAIDSELAVLRATYERKLLAGTAAAALTVTHRTQLAGLSDDEIASYQTPGGFRIPLQSTTQQPALASLSVRDTRKALFDTAWTRSERGDANDTRATILRMAQLRAQKAQIFGYRDYAAYALVDEMAKTPITVQHFLSGLIAPTRANVLAERRELQAQAAQSGNTAPIEPWDWEYYASQLREQKYALTDAQVRPYFELNNVLQNGLFYAANRLYGVTFQERHDLPTWNPDVRVFNVYDKDGSALGIMYFDFFKRDTKQGGAWMSTLVPESRLLHTKPVLYNAENFTKPAPGHPALLSFGEVSGMFHEFGHALNGFFATAKYASLGFPHARDFAEYPSQFNEHWALYPDVFKHFAFHYQTHAPMPQALMDKIKQASGFDQAYSMGELLAADELDQAWHGFAAGNAPDDVDAFETAALKATGTDFPSVPPRYRSSYYSHIWGSGYAAKYYGYMWSEMLDDDTYEWFLQHGGLTRANGDRFRKLVLSRGYTEEYAPMFRSFFGRSPDVAPLLKYRGLAK